MKIRRSAVLCSLVAGNGLLVGCGGQPGERTDLAPGSTAEEIIGGFAANSPKLDAVGELVVRTAWDDGTTSFTPFCTGTLIAPNTVLTAKHCAVVFEEAHPYGQEVAFAIGPNGLAPKQMVEVVEIEKAPGDEGGFIGYGRDVATLHLLTNVENVTPLAYRPLVDSMLHKDLVVVGYGAVDNNYTSGTRMLGKVELVARRGRPYQIMLGSFAAFYEWYTGLPIPPECRECAAPDSGVTCSDPMVEWIRPLYDTMLEEGYEVVAGGTPGDAQPCFGDSGGPLLKADASGKLVVYGVVSGGLFSSELICDYGGVYGTLGPETLALVDHSMQWVDQCGGLSYKGTCDGTVARRCTRPPEGPRRLVDVDCDLLGLSCERQPDGRIGCGLGDDATGMAPEPPLAGQTPPDYRQSVNAAFKRPPH